MVEARGRNRMGVGQGERGAPEPVQPGRGGDRTRAAAVLLGPDKTRCPNLTPPDHRPKL